MVRAKAAGVPAKGPVSTKLASCPCGWIARLSIRVKTIDAVVAPGGTEMIGVERVRSSPGSTVYGDCPVTAVVPVPRATPAVTVNASGTGIVTATPSWPMPFTAVPDVCTKAMPGAMVMVTMALPEPPTLAAVTVTAVWIGIATVPVIAPELRSRVRPSGSPVAAKVVGVLVAVI